jgi:hypothetical protein
MSYGATVADAVHQAGISAGKILSGDKAADLPVIEVRDQPQDRPRRLAAALQMSPFGPKAKPAHVRLHVGYWRDERNCCKWDQSVAVDPKPNKLLPH